MPDDSRNTGQHAVTLTAERQLGVPNEGERPVFAPDGTDLTLIRQMLALTPEERIRALEAMIVGMRELRDARET